MCFNETGATTQRRPVQLAAGAPISIHLPELAAIAGGAIPAVVLESAQEAAQEPQESVSKARSSDGRLRSEEHTSELQSLMRISYAVFCLKKKKQHIQYK